MQSIVDYFDVRKEFVSYLVYHRNPLNRLIHMVTEPVLYICLLFLANNFLPPLDGTGVNFAVIINLVYMISYIFMEIPAGILFMPFMGVMYYVAVYILHKEQWMWVILIQFGCFALLLLSHHFLEKKTPPFQPFLLQGFHAALFFVWLDLLFQFGYKRHLHDEIDALVTSELKKTQGGWRSDPHGLYGTKLKVGEDIADVVYEFFLDKSKNLKVTLGVTCNDVHSITDRNFRVKEVSHGKYEVQFGNKLGVFLNDVKDKCNFLKLKPGDFVEVSQSVPPAIEIQLQGKPASLYSPQMEADLGHLVGN
ncbi:hypothetical protein FOL47_000102 [Perkinsus chesapeaki]|uniref:Uncharacterized protein n=2 Tax=Alveolata TaxID=33630 RepID=A0A7J6N184_PERCH|nr:hypothetical protein FOL47_000102 [Perkinsus chesapeaki]